MFVTFKNKVLYRLDMLILIVVIFFFILIFCVNTCTVHLLLFCTMTNKCTIISQIIALLHVSTLSCHPQQPVINTLPSYTSISNAAVGNIVYN